MDNSPTFVMSIDAETPVQAWLEEVRPTLFLRCAKRRVEVYMHAGTAANTEYGRLDEARFRVRIDEGEPRAEYWNESTSGKSFFAPNGLRLVRQLAGKGLLRVEFTPFNASPVVVRFDLSGIDAHLPGLLKTCGVSSGT